MITDANNQTIGPPLELKEPTEVVPTEVPVSTEEGVIQVPQPTDEVAGFPVWGWLAVALLVIVLVWSLIAKRSKPKSKLP